MTPVAQSIKEKQQPYLHTVPVCISGLLKRTVVCTGNLSYNENKWLCQVILDKMLSWHAKGYLIALQSAAFLELTAIVEVAVLQEESLLLAETDRTVC